MSSGAASRRMPLEEIHNEKIQLLNHHSQPELDKNRSIKKKTFNSPESLKKDFKELTGSKREHHSQMDLKASLGTTARKRRLMLKEDAACSSINFAQNELKSNADSTGSRPVKYQSANGSEAMLRNILEIQDLEMTKVGSGNLVTGAGVVDETEITHPNFEIRHD